jgi:hypothetical protein
MKSPWAIPRDPRLDEVEAERMRAWNDNEPREGELCGKVAGYFTPCILPRGHEGPCKRVQQA